MPLAEGREVSAVTADGVPVALSPEALFPFPTTAPVPFILTPRLLPSECRRPVTSSPNSLVLALCPLTVAPQPDLTACEQRALSGPASAPSRSRLAVPCTVPPGDGAHLMRLASAHRWTCPRAHCPLGPRASPAARFLSPSALGARGASSASPHVPEGKAPVSLCTPGPGSGHMAAKRWPSGSGKGRKAASRGGDGQCFAVRRRGLSSALSGAPSAGRSPSLAGVLAVPDQRLGLLVLALSTSCATA